MENSFIEAVFKLFEKMIEDYKDIEFKYPINAYLTGGVAIHFYTKVRASDDVDAILTETVKFPSNLMTTWKDSDGSIKTLSYDDNYHPDFGLIAEDFENRSKFVKCIDNKINIHLLHPLDLIITKISRFSVGDEEDIKAIIQVFNIDKKQLTTKINYELDGRFMNETDRNIYQYKLEEICEWIDEKNSQNEKCEISSENEIEEIIKSNIEG